MTDEPDGLYINDRGDVYRVRKRRVHYAYRYSNGSIRYESRLKLPPDCTRLDSLEAVRAAFPHVSDNCLFCGRPFTDPHSKLLGIGPDCCKALAFFRVSHERIAMMRATGETRLDLAESNEDAIARMARRP